MSATRTQRNWLATTVSPNVANLVDELCSASNTSRSEFLRTGIRLALQDAIAQGVDDPDLELRALRYLHDTSRN